MIEMQSQDKKDEYKFGCNRERRRVITLKMASHVSVHKEDFLYVSGIRKQKLQNNYNAGHKVRLNKSNRSIGNFCGKEPVTVAAIIGTKQKESFETIWYTHILYEGDHKYAHPL